MVQKALFFCTGICIYLLSFPSRERGLKSLEVMMKTTENRRSPRGNMEGSSNS